MEVWGGCGKRARVIRCAQGTSQHVLTGDAASCATHSAAWTEESTTSADAEHSKTERLSDKRNCHCGADSVALAQSDSALRN
eukprot:scaffold308830_cov33-Tisochrysis_lutea.AAC.1